MSRLGRELAFGRVTGQILTGGEGDGDATAFSWTGNDEMDKPQGHGWAERHTDGPLTGAISSRKGDEANFIAGPDTSSTAC